MSFELSPLFSWRGAIADKNSGLKPMTRLVALTLSLHMNERGGSCFPAIPTLAEESGLSARRVQIHLGELRDAGWLTVTYARGRTHTNRYTATVPTGKGDASVTFPGAPNGEKVTESALKGDASVTRGRQEDVTPRPDVEVLCDLLVELVVENGSRKPPITKAWRDEARRLIDRDGIELGEAQRVMRWALTDPFWRANILSMPKFREKYDQLKLKANGCAHEDNSWMDRSAL